MSVSSGPVIPGNRIYPGTSQHWTYRQIISYPDFVKAAILITAAILVAVAAVGFATGLWP